MRQGISNLFIHFYFFMVFFSLFFEGNFFRKFFFFIIIYVFPSLCSRDFIIEVEGYFQDTFNYANFKADVCVSMCSQMKPTNSFE